MTKITPRDVNYDNKKPNTEPFEKRHGAGAGRDQIPPPLRPRILRGLTSRLASDCWMKSFNPWMGTRSWVF
jgi:hypothetical protein